jgi:hypothetical protein
MLKLFFNATKILIKLAHSINIKILKNKNQTYEKIITLL